MQVVKQALAAAKEELSPILAPLLPLLQAVHNAHHFPCCLDAVAAAVEACGQLASCRACLVAAVGSFIEAVLSQLQVVLHPAPVLVRLWPGIGDIPWPASASHCKPIGCACRRLPLQWALCQTAAAS